MFPFWRAMRQDQRPKCAGARMGEEGQVWVSKGGARGRRGTQLISQISFEKSHDWQICENSSFPFFPFIVSLFFLFPPRIREAKERKRRKQRKERMNRSLENCYD